MVGLTVMACLGELDLAKVPIIIDVHCLSEMTSGGTLTRCRKCATVQVNPFKSGVRRGPDVIVATTIRSMEHWAELRSKPPQPLERHYRFFLILACLLCLPGCSGCEKVIPETPPKPQEAAAPSDRSVPEVETKIESSEIQSESEPHSVPSEKSPANDTNANTVAGPVGAAPANESKSSVVNSSASKVSAGPRVPGTSEPSPSQEPQTLPKSARKSKTAAEALETAESFQALAGIAASLGKYGRAFQFTSDAWEAAHAFPQDSACQALCKKLETELESLAERANAVVEPVDAKTKKLVDQ